MKPPLSTASLVMTFMLLVATLLNVGCATPSLNDCDPSADDPGVVRKAQCHFSGIYQQRVENKETLLLTEQTEKRRYQAAYSDIMSESDQVTLELDQQVQQLNRLRLSVTDLLQAIESSEITNEATKEAIVAVRVQLLRMEQGVYDAQARQQPISLVQQRHELTELQVRVEDLSRFIEVQ